LRLHPNSSCTPAAGEISGRFAVRWIEAAQGRDEVVVT
jgi:hypothetical protein